MAQKTQIRTVVKGFDLASACRRAGLEEGEVFVAATPADESGGGYWVCSWDGAEAHDLSPRHPYETEAEAIEAAREALAQR